MHEQVLTELVKQWMAFDRRQAVFGWQGGEPTLAGLPFFQQVVALQKQFGANGQVVSNGLQTNGLLLDADWARFLREYHFLVGVSLDGPAHWHDLYRQTSSGRGTHEQVMRSLRLLRRFNVETNILSVINRETARHPLEIYEFFLNQGFTYLQFIPCVEFDPNTGMPTEFSVTPELYGDFMCTLFDRWYNHGHPESSIRDFDAALSVYLGQPSPMCCYQERCGSYVVVEYSGDIYPCDFFVQEELKIGNLLEMSLAEAFSSQSLQAFAEAKAAPRPECAVCAWKSLCQQGCPRFLYQDKHYLCAAYQRFWAHSQAGFRALAEQIMQSSRTPAPAAIGRNDACPCGSGRKYKHCCGRRTL